MHRAASDKSTYYYHEYNEEAGQEDDPSPLGSFDNDDDDLQHPGDKWSLLHDAHENVNHQKSGKFRNHRKQKKKKKEPEARIMTIKRRNTLDAIIFNEMCDKADQDCENEAREEAVKEGSRRSKRTLKLLRTNERDSKLDVDQSSHYEYNTRHCCLFPKNIKVETRNRFRCLRSKPVDCIGKKHDVSESSISTSNNVIDQDDCSDTSQSLREREIFHDTFSFLIRLGSTDKDRICRRQISQEETRWQNELKDLIWLELQAYSADLSPMAMDEYLCKQREGVRVLLEEIMSYRFDPKATFIKEESDLSSLTVRLCIEASSCRGCLSMYCRDCTRAQSEALRQVESFLTRLESAEALFPSSQAFALQYPLYKSPEFTDRVKAMCLWYNMTKHHRLKLVILGKLLTLLHRNKKPDDTSQFDSGIGSHTSDNTSPSDSNNSNISNVSSSAPHTDEFSLARSWYLSSPESSFNFSEDDKLERLEFYLTEFDRQAYRKYIEDVLKTRGLRKSLNFLERLHTSVLRKARLALEKSSTVLGENMNLQEEYEGDQELRRYGVWSPEAKDLNLPSYRAAFIFLSRVPLDVIHEFLRMRLEQKPEQPSPLSVRQLMRELREGLRIACLHRERFAEHSLTVAACDEPCNTIMFDEDVKEFDKSLKSVFDVYLEYLQLWVEMVHHDSFHKNLIHDEWNFVKSIASKIKNGSEIAGRKFCEIAKIMVKQIKEFLIERPHELRKIYSNKNKKSSIRLQIMSVGREWQVLFDEGREKVVKCVTLAKLLRDDIQKFLQYEEELKSSVDSLMLVVMDLKCTITKIVTEFQKFSDEYDESKLETDYSTFRIRIREILHHAYRMGFEYYKELCKCINIEERCIIVKSLINFAFLWMEFVKNYCERGRGLRPRWANQGLEFLMTVCEPINTKHLSQDEFEQLKTSMDHCISHVVGSASKRDTSTERDSFKKFSGSRAASPHCRSRTSSISSTHNSTNCLKQTEVSSKLLKPNSPISADDIDSATYDGLEKNFSRHERVTIAVQNLDYQIDQKLKSRELIGQIVDRKNVDKVKIKSRRVNFTWQRGIKIGQGRFGKVYTVVNNQTGELLAMKEVQLQPGDCRAIKRVAEELQIFEGIQHKHLVRYYGVEIHREEMLIFMEFCAEGTLESLVVGSGNGLPESLLRKYTHQLLLAVSVLHSHGIVHRDIKTANIFLTDEGNCLKLGDFGSAVQIKAHTTMPGELQGFVGTQAYMAPEVFMKNETSGHGRAADIWSIGCCVVEMASGKRPWSEYDSNYQIMFKVGMGESPQPPKNLSLEGIDFITKCLQHDARKRPTASTLLTHTFARSYEDVMTDLFARTS